MDTFSKHINRRHIFKSLPEEMIIPKDCWDTYYNHHTLRISSLSEFINIISKLTEKSVGTEYERLVYRGHSDSSSKYKLIPALARYDDALEGSENVIVDELITERPEDFQSIPSDFDLLAKMQHYGLPTRLLDFSYNPLIALFFACCEGKTSGMAQVLDTSISSNVNVDADSEYVIHGSKVIDLSKIDVDELRLEIKKTPYKAIEIDDLKKYLEEALQKMII